MTQSSQNTSLLFKSRTILLKLLQEQDFNITDYEEFSVNEVHIMNNNKQLDMLMSKTEKPDKIYVKYHLAKTLRRENINDYIDDLYNLEQVLNKGDTLMILIKQDPNEPLLNILNQIWEQDGIFIIIYNLNRLQFNILEHEYVPKHIILSDTETIEFKKNFNINNDSEIPQISRYDPVAVAIGIRPGQVCKIIRPSKTAITSNYYRICSQ
jgi:DNA-directed RNA polymerase subunit H